MQELCVLCGQTEGEGLMYYDEEINAIVIEEGEDQCFNCTAKTGCPLIDVLSNGGASLCEEGIAVTGCQFYRRTNLKVVKDS